MKIAILGAYQTKFGELWQQSLTDLLAEASLGALKASGLPAQKLEIAFLGNKLGPQTSDQNHLGALLAEILGVSLPVVRVEAACASGGMALFEACLALSSGRYQTALVVGAEKMSDLPAAAIAKALMSAASLAEQASGLTFSGLYALLAQRYLWEFGAKEEDLALVAVKNHQHAALNPKAQFPFPITLEEVMASPTVACPLKLLDCSPVTDGAAAVVLSTPQFAKKIKRKPIFITASQAVSQNLNLSQRKTLTALPATQEAGRCAFEEAGLGPKEIDLAEVHDCFTIAEILALEDLGFYAKGQGFLAVRNGEVKLGGKRPINLSGGLKACGHPVGATGIKQVVEIYQQLKGQAGQRQTLNPKVGLTHNVGGTGGTVVVHILQK